MHSLDLGNLLENVAVLGACGKMGRGIALILLQQMGIEALKKRHSSFSLRLVDPNFLGFQDLKVYLRKELLRFAEKKIQSLRELFSSESEIVSNREVIDSFVERTLLIADCSPAINHIQGSSLIFEAAFEDIELKVDLLKAVHRMAPEGWVFTNTSSIPIELLADRSLLREKLIGFHFYNPPPVQKLVEVIPSKNSDPFLLEIAKKLGEKLGKILVYSSDHAGFIGNGHFAREVVFACQLVEELKKTNSAEIAIQRVDRITKDFLLRPMGIFQLIDYVGWKVIDQVLTVMSTFLSDPKLEAPLIKKYVEYGVEGGQEGNGTQKNGIFSYKENKIEGTFSPKGYQSFEEVSHPMPFDLSWKKIQKDPGLMDKIPAYFQALFEEKKSDNEIAKRFLIHSKKIEELLVKTHVARSLEDIGIVLKNGFYHLYAPHEVI